VLCADGALCDENAPGTHIAVGQQSRAVIAASMDRAGERHPTRH
jgi:hypothetical protein